LVRQHHSQLANLHINQPAILQDSQQHNQHLIPQLNPVRDHHFNQRVSRPCSPLPHLLPSLLVNQP
jgi:hypothetical protein